jgi:hypothetical protein
VPLRNSHQTGGNLLARCRLGREVALDQLGRVLGQIAGVNGRHEAAGEVRVVPGTLGFPVVPVILVLSPSEMLPVPILARPPDGEVGQVEGAIRREQRLLRTPAEGAPPSTRGRAGPARAAPGPGPRVEPVQDHPDRLLIRCPVLAGDRVARGAQPGQTFGRTFIFEFLSDEDRRRCGLWLRRRSTTPRACRCGRGWPVRGFRCRTGSRVTPATSDLSRLFADSLYRRPGPRRSSGGTNSQADIAAEPIPPEGLRFRTGTQTTWRQSRRT